MEKRQYVLTTSNSTKNSQAGNPTGMTFKRFRESFRRLYPPKSCSWDHSRNIDEEWYRKMVKIRMKIGTYCQNFPCSPKVFLRLRVRYVYPAKFCTLGSSFRYSFQVWNSSFKRCDGSTNTTGNQTAKTRYEVRVPYSSKQRPRQQCLEQEVQSGTH